MKTLAIKLTKSPILPTALRHLIANVVFFFFRVFSPLIFGSFAHAGTLIVQETSAPAVALTRLEEGRGRIQAVMDQLKVRVSQSASSVGICKHTSLEAFPELIQVHLENRLRALNGEYLELLQLNEDLLQAQQMLTLSEGLRKGSASLLGGTLLGKAWTSFKLASILGSFVGLGSQTQFENTMKTKLGVSAASAFSFPVAELTAPIILDLTSVESFRVSLMAGLKELGGRHSQLNEARLQALQKIPQSNRWYSLGADAEKSLQTTLDTSVTRVGLLLFEIESLIQWRLALRGLCE